MRGGVAVRSHESAAGDAPAAEDGSRRSRGERDPSPPVEEEREMHRRWILPVAVVTLGLLVSTGCRRYRCDPCYRMGSGTATSSMKSQTAAPDTPSYTQVEHDGRLYVLGSKKMTKKFMETKHLPYTQTHIAAGPNGETVVVEVDKGNPDFADDLWQTFLKLNFFYKEVEKNDRIYVIGQEETYAKFKENGHLPYTQTHIGEGPDGETVVIEVDKKNPNLAARLGNQFGLRHDIDLYADTTAAPTTAKKAAPVKKAKPAAKKPAAKKAEPAAKKKAPAKKAKAAPKKAAPKKAAPKKAAPKKAAAKKEAAPAYYAEEKHEGRIYVFGSKEIHQKFKKMHHMPYTLTFIGAGPKGETVVVEVDKKDPTFAQALSAAFEKKHKVELKK
jgi:hypothetical protein